MQTPHTLDFQESCPPPPSFPHFHSNELGHASAEHRPEPESKHARSLASGPWATRDTSPRSSANFSAWRTRTTAARLRPRFLEELAPFQARANTSKNRGRRQRVRGTGGTNTVHAAPADRETQITSLVTCSSHCCVGDRLSRKEQEEGRLPGVMRLPVLMRTKKIFKFPAFPFRSAET